MDWKTYRRSGAGHEAGRHEHDSHEPSFEFLPDQGPGRRFNYVPGKVVVPAECGPAVEAILEQNGLSPESEIAGFRLYSGGPIPQDRFIELLEDANSKADAGAGRIAPLHALTIQDHGDFGPAGPPVSAPPLPLRTVAGLPLAGEGVKVGVLDTGAYKAHPMLAPRLDDGSQEELIEFDQRTGHLKIGVGHGTFVAGVVARCAPGATIFARRVVSPDGVTNDFALAAALEELGPKVDILCLPLGGYAMDDRGPGTIMTILDRLYAAHEELVVVAAAGNDSRSDPFWPAAHPKVIGVGALDENGERAGYSNYGRWVDTYALGTGIHSAFVEWKDDPDVHAAAPSGVQTLETQALIDAMDDSVKNNDGPWATWSGTSFATPVVAGAIAAAMRPAGGPALAALKAASAVVLGRPRQQATGSHTKHTFVI